MKVDMKATFHSSSLPLYITCDKISDEGHRLILGNIPHYSRFPSPSSTSLLPKPHLHSLPETNNTIHLTSYSTWQTPNYLLDALVSIKLPTYIFVNSSNMC